MRLFQNDSIDPDPRRLKILLSALLQDGTSSVTERLALPLVVRRLYTAWEAESFGRAPRLAKAASYPTAAKSLTLGGNSDVLVSDSFWMLDLFAIGYDYCTRLQDYDAFQVVNASKLETWNSLTEEEARTCLHTGARDPIRTAVGIIEKFESLLGNTRFPVIDANCEIRQRHLDAIASVLNIPAPLDTASLLDDRIYVDYLSKAIDNLYSRNDLGSISAKRACFSAMVFAEERTLRDAYGITSYAGYVREELQLAATVLALCDSASDAMPYLFYTRPSEPPPVSFLMPEDQVVSAFEEPGSVEYAAEILLKIGALSTIQSRDSSYVLDCALDFRQQVIVELS